MRKQAEDRLFRVYVTDALKAVVDNTAALHSKCVSIKKRYIEIIDDAEQEKPNDEEPKETAEQIINRISAGLNALAAKKGSSADNDAGK